MSFKEKVIDKLAELTLASIISIIGLFGITITGTVALIKKYWDYTFTITISTTVGFIMGVVCVCFLVYVITRKLRSKQQFPNGSVVVLKTKSTAPMVVGRYRFWNNSVECYLNTYEKKWIRQESIKIYEAPTTEPKTQEKRVIIDSIWGNSPRSAW